MQTIFQKYLSGVVSEHFRSLSAGELLDKLFELGVVDHTLCKVLAVRELVYSLVHKGESKTGAMWIASERFCCSYEYVRKCMYYYKDVNIK